MHSRLIEDDICTANDLVCVRFDLVCVRVPKSVAKICVRFVIEKIEFRDRDSHLWRSSLGTSAYALHLNICSLA